MSLAPFDCHRRHAARHAGRPHGHVPPARRAPGGLRPAGADHGEVGHPAREPVHPALRLHPAAQGRRRLHERRAVPEVLLAEPAQGHQGAGGRRLRALPLRGRGIRHPAGDHRATCPTGRTVWQFDHTDMRRAKEVLGGVACIQGNVPVSLLQLGTAEEVTAYCRDLIDAVGPGRRLHPRCRGRGGRRQGGQHAGHGPGGQGVGCGVAEKVMGRARQPNGLGASGCLKSLAGHDGRREARVAHRAVAQPGRAVRQPGGRGRLQGPGRPLRGGYRAAGARPGAHQRQRRLVAGHLGRAHRRTRPCTIGRGPRRPGWTSTWSSSPTPWSARCSTPLPASVFETIDYKLYSWPGHGVAERRELPVQREGVDARRGVRPPHLRPLGLHAPHLSAPHGGGLRRLRQPLLALRLHRAALRLRPGRRLGHARRWPTVSSGWPRPRARSATGRAAIFPTIGETDGAGLPGLLRRRHARLRSTSWATRLRGTREVIIDMYRRPEKVLAACERLVPVAIDLGAQASGRRRPPRWSSCRCTRAPTAS